MQHFFAAKSIRYAALGLIGSAAQIGCRKPTPTGRIGLSAPAIRLQIRPEEAKQKRPATLCHSLHPPERQADGRTLLRHTSGQNALKFAIFFWCSSARVVYWYYVLVSFRCHLARRPGLLLATSKTTGPSGSRFLHVGANSK